VACPQVAERGNGLQLWRLAENTLNKQLRKSDKEDVKRPLGRPRHRWFKIIKKDLGEIRCGYGLDWSGPR
jgi:hypothetical protein